MLSDIYPPRYFARRYKLAWRAPLIADVIKALWHPTSVIDVGCAVGDIVQSLSLLGIDAHGIEGTSSCFGYLLCDLERVRVHDFRTPLPPMSYDLGLCFEVLEHFEEEFVPTVMTNLAQLSRRWVTSIALQGQLGVGHQNLQAGEYWDDKFASIGMWRDEAMEEEFRKRLVAQRSGDGMRAIWNNLRVYC